MIVSKKEAKKEAKSLLNIYGSRENFSECIEAISIIRAERGNTSLFDEDFAIVFNCQTLDI